MNNKVGLLFLNVPLAALASVVFILALLLQDHGPRDLVDAKLEPNEAAQALISMPKEDRAKLIARESEQLLREPLDLDALSNLAILRGVSGEQSNADAIVLEAARRSLRDTQTQVAAIRLFFASNDLEKAFFHIDGLLTARPELATSIFQALVALPDRDKMANGLARVLLRNPPWRIQFMNWIAKSEPSGLVAYKVFSRLRDQGGMVLDNELRFYLDAQFSLNNQDRAYFVWLDMLPPASLQKVGYIFDGGFDLQPRHLFFDWTVASFPNAAVDISPHSTDKDNKSLRVSFVNSTKPYSNLYQFLRLPPGKFVLEGEWMARNLRAPAGLIWNMGCVENHQLVMQSKAFAESAPWNSFSAKIEIPAKGCETQRLQLMSASPALLDAPIDGEYRFDNLRISVDTDSTSEKP